ncbi:MAG: hypothetical protein REI12_05060 [Pedobacter sp.]|nr:hypothetical protein [Pedobacter sp.]
MSHESTKIVFESESKEALDGLTARGYRYLGVSERRDALLGVYLRIEFENRDIGRKISLHHIPETKNRPDRLNLYFENGQGDFFSAFEYLKSQGGSPEAISRLQIRGYAGSLKERMYSCLIELRKLLDEALPTVVDGKDWMEVPVDWDGYR